MTRRSKRWLTAIALASAGLLSGCYYYPYDYYYPWGYPYPYFGGYPYAAGTYPPPPTPEGPPGAPNSVTGTLQAPTAPVQRTPLPPPAQ